MSADVAPRSSKHSGETVEANVLDRVPELAYVSDRTAEWHDAEVVTLLEPCEDVVFYALPLLAVGTVVEIKAAQLRLASGQRGRFYIRKRQHQKLLDANGVYLFAVYDPRDDHRVLRMAVWAASLVDELLPDGWTAVHGDRAEEGYRQLAWSRVIDPEEVDRR